VPVRAMRDIPREVFFEGRNDGHVYWEGGRAAEINDLVRLGGVFDHLAELDGAAGGEVVVAEDEP
jgi:hypothetical protein